MLKLFCGKCVHMLQQIAVTKPLSVKENERFFVTKMVQNQFGFFIIIQKSNIFQYFFQIKTTRSVCLYQHIWFIHKSWKGQRQHAFCMIDYYFLFIILIFNHYCTSSQWRKITIWWRWFSPWIMGVEFQKLKSQTWKYSQN